MTMRHEQIEAVPKTVLRSFLSLLKVVDYAHHDMFVGKKREIAFVKEIPSSKVEGFFERPENTAK